MLKKIILYGLILGAGIALLRLIEFKYLVLDHSFEIYGGLIALIFTVTGIWAGLKLTRKKEVVVEKEVTVEKEIIVEKEVVIEKPIIIEKEIIIDRVQSFEQNLRELEERNISRRELEVLELMSTGLSNQEIADKLFVSLSTVKSHTSNLFLKLGVERRTQAVQKAKELNLIP